MLDLISPKGCKIEIDNFTHGTTFKNILKTFLTWNLCCLPMTGHLSVSVGQLVNLFLFKDLNRF